MMLNPNEAEEKNYLQEIRGKLRQALERLEQKISTYAMEILETKRYLYENQAQLDSAEKAANRIEIHDHVALGDEAVKERTRLEKLLDSPYFGRIDFTDAELDEAEVFYLGVHPFSDTEADRNLIFDWRAPVSSLFYDFETGPAYYRAPMGKIKGTVDLKRQYRIKQGQMEYLLESSLNIGDEILQRELSRNADEKMKNIVATIQREQNAVIRNENARAMLIQGVAGSGKTSIALHRVAFLLYRYRETLNSENILIISPNQVFSHYIANVLPELGEENIASTDIDKLATRLLGKKYQCQTFFQQVESLVNNEDPEAVARIRFKATNDFVAQLKAYLEYADANYFLPTSLKFGNFSVAQEVILAGYQALSGLPIKRRLNKLAANLIAKYERTVSKRLDTATVRQIRSAVLSMFKFGEAFLLYQDFYRHIGREDLWLLNRKNALEFCDVYPLIYTKIFFEGAEREFKAIRHLLIDEMQDYTPIQYAVLSQLFSCPMTILGDGSQSVNPYSSSTVEKIRPFFADCTCLELNRSYRSTFEITGFAQGIRANSNLIPVERHGARPEVIICSTEDEQEREIRNLLQEFRQSGYTSLGMICKSQEQAARLFAQIQALDIEASLLSFDSSEFKEGIVVTSVHLAKGLEFDQVIVPDASADLYHTELDRSLLYIASTRAMHKLDLTCCGKRTDLLGSC